MQHPTPVVLYTGSGNTTHPISALDLYYNLQVQPNGALVNAHSNLKAQFHKSYTFYANNYTCLGGERLSVCTASSKWHTFPDHLHVKLHRRLYRTSHLAKMININFS
jgi:hypothetical protein